MKKAVIIGSGIAGIASAIRLQNKGYSVQILEKNDYPGGKITQLTGNGFRFDAGPSLFTMPNLVTELFEICGKKTSDYFNYDRLNVLCNYFYEDGTKISANSDIPTFAKEMSEKTCDSAESVKKHLEKSAFIYGATEEQFLNKSLHKISSFLSFSTLISIFKLPFLKIFSSMNQVNEKTFKDSKTIKIFNRYATYNGSNPYKAPGILNKILEGYKRLTKNKKFTKSKVIDNEAQAYLDEIDDTRNFVKECLHVKEWEDSSGTDFYKIYKDYVRYCDDSGINLRYALKKNQLSKELSRYIPDWKVRKKRKGKQGTVFFRGIYLQTNEVYQDF